ncbi:DUF421 domain-containing protein [Paenibacillus sp. GCM10027628]|uniref:DUF421 domain-containing protein n=1 Tax=Paenibacillus sp. GCM10027628 TaxID=3273413 RepID=UPI003644E848
MIQWILRAVIGYLFLLIATKLMGQRSISQLRFLDFTTALILGDIIANPLSDAHVGLSGPMITTTVLVVLYLLTSWLSLKWNALKHFLDPAPITLIQNGQIRMSNLSKAKISLDHLFSELRKQQVENIQKVALALWEPGGTISIFVAPQHQPATAADMNVRTAAFSLVRPIIIEGTPNQKVLRQLGKDNKWLKAKLRAMHQERKVALATIDDHEQIRVYKLSTDEKGEQSLS